MWTWILLLASCKDEPGRPPKASDPVPTWPEAPETVASSSSPLVPVLSPDGTALVWVEPVEDVGYGVFSGPLLRLDAP